MFNQCCCCISYCGMLLQFACTPALPTVKYLTRCKRWWRLIYLIFVIIIHGCIKPFSLSHVISVSPGRYLILQRGQHYFPGQAFESGCCEVAVLLRFGEWLLGCRIRLQLLFCICMFCFFCGLFLLQLPWPSSSFFSFLVSLTTFSAVFFPLPIF